MTAGGTLSRAARLEQEWAAYWDCQQARQQELTVLEAARECRQCHGTTEGSAIGWICDACRMSCGRAS